MVNELAKTHKQISKRLGTYDISGPVEHTIQTLQQESAGLKEPELGIEPYYDSIEVYIRGWVPKTPQELEKEEKARLKQKEREKKAKEAAKQHNEELFLNLAKTLGYSVTKKEK